MARPAGRAGTTVLVCGSPGGVADRGPAGSPLTGPGQWACPALLIRSPRSPAAEGEDRPGA